MAQNRFSRSEAGNVAGGNGAPDEFGGGSHMSSGGSATAINLGMVYFTLFRHKWKILICAAAGVIAAGAFYKLTPAPFTSEARLLVKYVQEKQEINLDPDARTRAPDTKGEGVMRAELEILTSFDLAEAVAAAMGPDRILERPNGGGTIQQAAGVVRGGLSAYFAPKSNILYITYAHSNRDLVQPILAAIVETYLKRHSQIHHAAGVPDEALVQETDQLKARLGDTETELQRILQSAGVISLDEAKRVSGEQIATLQSEIMAVQANLATARATLAAMTGEPAPEPVSPEPSTTASEIPSDKISAYRQITGQLNLLYQREQELLMQFTAETPMVKGIRAQITENEDIRKRLETDHPALRAQASRVQPRAANLSGSLGPDPAAVAVQVRGLESRLDTLTRQLDQVRKDAKALSSIETTINELTRKKELQEKQYINFLQALERSRLDAALSEGRVYNIAQLQAPPPPRQDRAKAQKVAAVIAAAGIGLGLGLAFAIEMFLDPSVKRPGEVESSLGLPLVLSIPQMKKAVRTLNGSGRPLLGAGARSDGRAVGQPDGPTVPPSDQALTPWSANHELRTFFDALRNRLVYSFEMRAITRKPKLVAVTSCGADSGVSTIAAGLAASLSETGDGNVLLVDMNPDRKTPQLFQKGDLKVGLDDVLAQETRDDAMVGENLYMVSQQSAEDRLSWIMPKKFAQLVPKMKASDFDYIIFDMPPVSQISATPQLARFMDQVLMVVESEKTSRDSVKRAGAMLAEAGANVGVVLNKTRSYVPKALDHDALAS